MKSSFLRSLVLVAGLAVVASGFQIGAASAAGTMPPGSYECRPLSDENFLPPPPVGGSSDEMTPEDEEATDAAKLTTGLCPPGMIAYPVAISGDIAHPGTPGIGNGDVHPGKAEKPQGDVHPGKADKPKSKNAKKRCLAKAKSKKAKKRCLAKAKASSRR